MSTLVEMFDKHHALIARIVELEVENEKWVVRMKTAQHRIAELEAERDRLRKELAALMIRHSFATGHGDTIDALLDELDWQLSEQKART